MVFWEEPRNQPRTASATITRLMEDKSRTRARTLRPGKTLGSPDWQQEEVRYELERLKNILLDPNATAEERAIAQAQLDNYLASGSES